MGSPRVLMVFHSEEGQTAKVATRVAATLRGLGAEVQGHVIDAHAGSVPLPLGFDAVVVGDPIHAGHHSPTMVHYLSEHRAQLDEVPCALFQVSLTSATHDPVHDAQAWGYVEELERETGFAPAAIGLFGGALAYRRYGWLKRRIMQHVAEQEGADTDTSRDWEYTDWDAVDRFAQEVFELASHARAG